MSDNPYFPILLDLRGRRCLVVGGGPVGSRKAESLRDAGAAVVLVSKLMSPDALSLTGIERHERPYAAGDLDGVWLVISAVDDRSVTAQIAADCEAAGIFLNAADDPPYCSSILPALHRDGPVLVAVSTGGASPATAGWIRDRIASDLGDLPGRVVRHLSEVRDRVRRTRTSEGLPWRTLIAPVAEALERGDRAAAERATDSWLRDQGLGGDPGLAESDR